MKAIFKLLSIVSIFFGVSSFDSLAEGKNDLYVVTTGDVHGAWFNKSYIDSETNSSLMSVMAYVEDLRASVGEDRVLLLDAGDSMQGDNAAYYFNYVDTEGESFFVRIMSYMGYDALAVGNHDIETGHGVYDKVYAELEAKGIPFLAANALHEASGDPYFPEYKCFDKAGLKVVVLGFTNAYIKSWLSEEVWRGMDFTAILPMAQAKIDEIREKENPDVFIILSHTASGDGSGTIPESEGLDMLHSLHGVDMIITGHDHAATVVATENCVLVNAGSKAKMVSKTRFTVDKRGDKVVSKEVYSELINLDKDVIDEEMARHFEPEYKKVKAFSNAKIGSLPMKLKSQDAFAGMSDYINLTHTVMLSPYEAQISFSAPLKMNGVVNAGNVIYNDLFTIYPFENHLYVVSLTGKEIKDYLEYSYNTWIQNDAEHVLNISRREDSRNGTKRWSFNYQSYNFDSAAGLNYTVDITKPFGERVKITSLADGSAFDERKSYNVSMTSYRFNGGGNLLVEGAGIPKEELDDRVVAVYPAIRDMIHEMFLKHGKLTPEIISNKNLLGEWKFVPEGEAEERIRKDLQLIFGW